MLSNGDLAQKISENIKSKDSFIVAGSYIIVKLVLDIIDLIDGKYGFPKKENLSPELLKIFTKQEVLEELIPIIEKQIL